MATQQHSVQRGDGRTTPRLLPPKPEPPVGDLIRQLGTDGATLVRNEVALAKLEIREMAREIALDSARLFGALTVALAGMLALLTAGIIALGNVLDGQYALAALIVGGIMVLEMVAVLANRIFATRPVEVAPGYSNTKELGRVLYTQYAFAFEIAAVLLLVAIIAAIALTLRRRKDSRSQDPAAQVRARRAERVQLVSMPAEKE